MQTPKLLIAESNEELCQALTDLLSEHYHICTCRSGDRAQQLLRSFAPDIIYIDLMLPQVDGITVLNTALQEGIRPTILASISFESPYISDALSRLQVDYVVKKLAPPRRLQATSLSFPARRKHGRSERMNLCWIFLPYCYK